MRRRSCNWSTVQGVKRIDATFQGKLILIYALLLLNLPWKTKVASSH